MVSQKLVTVKQIQNISELKSGINDNDKYLLFIYANWCGHCKSMKPDMEKFKTEAKKKIGNVFIGCIEDAIIKKNPGISEYIEKELKKNVRGYPTIIYGKKGDEPSELNGPRDLGNFNNILSKLCSQNGGKKKKPFRKKKTKKRRTMRKRKKRRKKKTKRKSRK